MQADTAGKFYITFPFLNNLKILFPRAMSQAAALARIFGECREGQIPRSSAAGYLTVPVIFSWFLLCFG